MDKILTATDHVVYDTTTGGFPAASLLNLAGTSTIGSNLISVKVTAISSPGTSKYRGFWLKLGEKHHRLKYSFDYRFAPDVEGGTVLMDLCGYEGANQFRLTMTPEWQSYSGVATRPTYSDRYSGFTFYSWGTSFPLGTFYLRNVKIESAPWVYTIGGKPLKGSV